MGAASVSSLVPMKSILKVGINDHADSILWEGTAQVGKGVRGIDPCSEPVSENEAQKLAYVGSMDMGNEGRFQLLPFRYGRV